MLSWPLAEIISFIHIFYLTFILYHLICFTFSFSFSQHSESVINISVWCIGPCRWESDLIIALYLYRCKSVSACRSKPFCELSNLIYGQISFSDRTSSALKITSVFSFLKPCALVSRAHTLHAKGDTWPLKSLGYDVMKSKRV